MMDANTYVSSALVTVERQGNARLQLIGSYILIQFKPSMETRPCTFCTATIQLCRISCGSTVTVAIFCVDIMRYRTFDYLG